MAFDDYNIMHLPIEKLIVFIISTTGEGDPP